MMKLRNLMQVACMATAALTAFSCSQEEFENSGRKGNITVNATFEGAGTDTRTTVNDEYKILWQDTDALGLFCSNAESNYSNTKLEYASGAGQTSATFNGSKPSGETAVFSIYPYQQNMSVSGNTLTMTLPATLTNYNGSSNGPMYAKVTNPDNLSALSFKHMAAMIKLTVNKIPAEATTFKIIASNNIAGTCTVDLTAADPILAVTSDESKEITASFTASADIKSRNFYIPLPTGTYSSITAQLTNGSDKVYFTKTLNDKILGRRDILVVPPLDCVVVEATTPSALSTALADSKNLPQEAPTAATVTDIAVSGSFNTTSGSNDGIAIPVLQNSDINLTFNTAPTTSTAAPLTLTDKTNTSVSAPAATATNSVSLAVPETTAEQEAPSVAITMPSTTVTLAAVGNKATYNEVTATTAQQTLIINAGVTVKKLTVKGGNLKIYGKVEQLVHDAGDTTIYIIKGTEASLPATIDSKFVVQSDVAVLKTAFANGEDFKLSADADITGQSVSVPAGKSVVLDLNGYTLTADNSATGKIIVLGKMTLKDSSTEKKGKIVASQDYTAASYNGSLIEIAGEDASMTMESGNISAVRETPDSNGQYGVGVTDGGDFTMTGGKIEAGWFAVAGNGNYKTQNSIINITDGELISTADYAVYLPQSGTTTISGGKVYGAAGGVCIQRGTLNVEGTALITSKGTGSTGNWGDGTGGLDCAAINVSGAYGIATVNIKGGTLIAEAKSLITEGTTYTPVINVTGGTFSDPSVLKYMATNATVDIKLLSNINIAKTELATGYILNAANATANLNLNGHDIINSSETADATPFTQIFTVQNGTLNISGNGNVKCDASATAKDDGYRMVIEARGYGTVNIHGGSYYNTQKLNTQIDLIYARENGKINIYGGTFESGKYGTPNNDTDGRYWVLNLKNTDKNTASIQVSGGTFINFNPANPNMDDNESYLVTGYEVTRDGSVYTAAHKVNDGRKEYIVGPTSQENR
ncbi:fimbrillin family protein [Bacteroides uniformis]|uniref:fimbrillin family protein n=1 Tax=Bacteroides uniformis TaxID=820 RepID=UPI003F209097